MPRITAPTSDSGLTLVELLVVIAVIGTLVALLLPAVVAARSAARRTHCKSNLRQLGLAIQAHHDAHGRFPSGGWGFSWVGIAGRGSGSNQPGGWAYSLLPFLGYSDLYRMEETLGVTEGPAARARRAETAIAVFVCPERRETRAWPTASTFPSSPSVVRAHLKQPNGSAPIESAARADYAMNSGSTFVTPFSGPASIAQAESGEYVWPEWEAFDGIGHLRSDISMREVSDGLSHTYLLGEKFLSPSSYHDGTALGDNETLYTGYSTDLHRFTRIDLTPAQDRDAGPAFFGDARFGSAHAASFPMVFCDGSLRDVAYNIDPETHRENGTRRTPLVLPSPIGH